MPQLTGIYHLHAAHLASPDACAARSRCLPVSHRCESTLPRTLSPSLADVQLFSNLLHQQTMQQGAGGDLAGRRGGPPRPDALIPRSVPPVRTPVLQVTRFTIRGCPTFDLGGGCDPYVQVKLMRLTWRADFGAAEARRARVLDSTMAVQTQHLAHDSRASGCPHYAHGADAELPCGSDEHPLLIQGDVSAREALKRH